MLKGGRSLERQVSLRSGARVEDALERLGHEVRRHRRRPRPRRAAARGDAGRGLRRPARARRRGRHRAGAARGRSASPTPARGCRPACAAPTRCWPSTRCATPGCRRRTSTPSRETAFKELGAAEALRRIEERLGFPIVVKPADQGCALGIKFARHAPPTCPPRSSPRSPTPRRCCSSATSHGRELAVSVLGERGAAGRRGGPARGGLLRLRGALRDRAHRASSARPSWPTTLTARAQELALDVYRLLGCRGFARVDLMLEDGTDELYVLEVQRRSRA